MVLDVAPFLVRFWYIPGLNHLAGSGDMDESRDGSRIVYPKWPEALTLVHLIHMFAVTHAETQWGGPVALELARFRKLNVGKQQRKTRTDKM